MPRADGYIYSWEAAQKKEGVYEIFNSKILSMLFELFKLRGTDNVFIEKTLMLLGKENAEILLKEFQAEYLADIEGRTKKTSSSYEKELKGLEEEKQKWSFD